MRPSALAQKALKEITRGWGGISVSARMSTGLQTYVRMTCDEIVASVGLYGYADNPRQVEILVETCQNASACSSVAALKMAFEGVMKAAEALCENRSAAWLNALRIQARTDVFNKSLTFIKTEAASRNDGWDARNLLFITGLDSLALEGESMDALRMDRVRRIGKDGEASLNDQRLVLAAQIALGKGANSGCAHMPTFTTEGVAVGGNCIQGLGQARVGYAPVKGNESAGVVQQTGGVLYYQITPAVATAYSDIFEWTFALSNLSGNYYAVATVELSATAFRSGVTVAPLHAPNITAPSVPKIFRLLSCSWTTPDGKAVFHDYSSCELFENALNVKFSVNIVGGGVTPVTVRYAVESQTEADDYALSFTNRCTFVNYVLDPTQVIAQTTKEVKYVNAVRFDDALGNGFMNVGDMGSSMGGSIQCYSKGAYVNTLMANTVDALLNGGSDSMVAKYVAFNPAIDSREKLTNPAYWTMLSWPTPDSVRRTTYNFFSDMRTAYALLPTSTFSNTFQTKYFSAAVVY